jgi:hypothetical protein
MRLFRKRGVPERSWADEVPGLAEFARSRGWQSITADPFGRRLAVLIHHLSWVVYDRRHPGALLRDVDISQDTVFRDAYIGSVDTRRVAVANGWTNIGPQELVKLYEMKGVAVCAAELPSLSPILLVQTRRQPLVERYPTSPTGSAAFDERFSVALSPGVDPGVVTPELQQLIMAHDDWAFAGHESWFACVSRGPFESATDVGRRVDELLAVIAAFPTSVVPAQIDRSADDLLARVERLSSPQEVVAFLGRLTPAERRQLAESNTPLAAFADVTTWEEVMARLQALDVPQRMQLLAMLKRGRADN